MNENTLRKNLLKPGVALRYKFTYNSVDYTDLLLDNSFSTISREINLSAGLMPLVVNNAGGWWNGLFATNTALESDSDNLAKLQLYVNGDTTNILTLFQGYVKDPRYEGSTVRLMIKDHAADWLNKKVGSNESPATWFQGNAASVVGADARAWKLLTDSEYGGLDSTDSPSNADIDYARFADWRDNHIKDNNYELRGTPTGQTVGELLMMICQLTHSYIWINNDGKVSFAPPYQPGYDYDENNTGSKARPGHGRDLYVVTNRIINDVKVRYTYNWSTGKWGGDADGNQSTSKTAFGTYHKTVESRIMFHKIQASAQADRTATISNYAYPIRYFDITAGFPAFMEDICNAITISDTLKGITDETAYIEKMTYDLDNMEVRMEARWPW